MCYGVCHKNFDLDGCSGDCTAVAVSVCPDTGYRAFDPEAAMRRPEDVHEVDSYVCVAVAAFLRCREGIG